MNSKNVPSPESSSPVLVTREDLMAELAALRKESRSKEGDAAKAAIKEKIKALGAPR